jgi:hypothetical protein
MENATASSSTIFQWVSAAAIRPHHSTECEFEFEPQTTRLRLETSRRRDFMGTERSAAVSRDLDTA